MQAGMHSEMRDGWAEFYDYDARQAHSSRDEFDRSRKRSLSVTVRDKRNIGVAFRRFIIACLHSHHLHGFRDFDA
jgi:hypothetical protein